jgi:hypothetical protein
VAEGEAVAPYRDSALKEPQVVLEIGIENPVVGFERGVEVLLELELLGDHVGVDGVAGGASELPLAVLFVGVDGDALPFGGADEAGLVGVDVVEAAHARIVGLDGYPVMAFAQVSAQVDFVERPMALEAARRSATDVEAVHVEAVGLVRRDVEGGFLRKLRHVEVVPEAREMVVEIAVAHRPDPPRSAQRMRLGNAHGAHFTSSLSFDGIFSKTMSSRRTLASSICGAEPFPPKSA